MDYQFNTIMYEISMEEAFERWEYEKLRAKEAERKAKALAKAFRPSLISALGKTK